MRCRVYFQDEFINFYKIPNDYDRPEVFEIQGFIKIKKSTYDFFLDSFLNTGNGEIERSGYHMYSVYL